MCVLDFPVVIVTTCIMAGSPERVCWSSTMKRIVIGVVVLFTSKGVMHISERHSLVIVHG